MYAATLWKDYCSYCNFKDFSIHSIRADLAAKNLRHISMNSYSAHHTTQLHTIFFSCTAYFDFDVQFLWTLLFYTLIIIFCSLDSGRKVLDYYDEYVCVFWLQLRWCVLCYCVHVLLFALLHITSCV